MSPQFFDTNVLVYAYDASDPRKQEIASHLILKAARARQAVTSVQVLQEFYVTVTRKIAEPLAPEIAAERIAAFARWRVHSPMSSDVLAATYTSASSRVSFWDAMIITSAHQMDCDTLWSEDLNAEQRINGVILKNPFLK